MKRKIALPLLPVLFASILLAGCTSTRTVTVSLPAPSKICPFKIDGLFYETATGRTPLPAIPFTKTQAGPGQQAETKMLDGRVVTISVTPDGNDFSIRLSATPDADIVKWGLAVDADTNEYFTGLMERVVDGPQQASWATNLTAAMNLRGEKVDMIVKPTLSVYAPFYISSRGYAVFVKGNWPGRFDFCASDRKRVKIEFEGPSFEAKIYTADNPAALVRAHALDAGPPFLPPKWMYGTWRWRDENTQRTNYYDGTPVTGPFNSEFMEDVLLMKAYGIPLGIYWMDRPWSPGPDGYDDFEIDTNRLPNFAESIKWLNGQNVQMFLWIGPYFQGQMETNALARGWTLASAGQKPAKSNYPLADFTNPEAKKYWQGGVAKLLKLGATGFKLDRSEENIPQSGPYHVFDGRSLRREAGAGSSAYGVFWGGDIGGTQEGLRAEIIAVQRAAVMGYPNWGSDTCGYLQQSMDTEVCGRWLGFSCFTPIMEAGPTKNRAFWDFHNPPGYDAELIAIWRLYARLHTRLADYSFEQAKVAHETGMPIVRPLFLVEPKAPAAWSNWWTYLYGPDILVSPIWQKNQRTQEVYLPSISQWRDAWNPEKIYDGGQTITVNAGLHQMPVFVRVGSNVELGDLNQEWTDAVAAANTRPDLKQLDAEVREWFEKSVRR